MATLSVKLLGPFEVLKGDEPITKFESDRVRALLAYLAVEADRPHRREHLAALLWPDWPERSARTNLRRALSNLRQAIGDHDADPPYFQITRQTIQFNSASDALVDALVIASSASIDIKKSGNVRKLEEAVDLYQSDFLEGFTVADSDSFEEWALLTREQLNRIMRDGVQQLAEHYAGKNEYQTAIGHYRRLLKMDPLLEEAHRGLMKLLASSGQRSAALAQYEVCRRILEQELGVAPALETRALFDQISSGELEQIEHDRAHGNIRGYELKERIGAGRFGEVYRAYQKQMGRDVVIKIIPPQYANQPEFIRRFESDARRVARLEHPHIVPLYDYWREPDGAYLVMRWLKEGSLRASLQRGAWNPQAICMAIDQISGALSNAHQQGIVHGDLQPSNILLDREGNVYLADFGITTDLLGGFPAGEKAGPDITNPYVAPEQLNEESVTSKTDLYGLGLVLYAMFTGETQWDSPESSSIQENGFLPAVSEFRDDVPDTVDSIIQRATAEDPADRYEDVIVLSEDLRKVLCIDGGESRIVVDRDLKNPYKGLRPFFEADAGDFFGREVLIEQLADRLKAEGGTGRFLALVGPSGSGKSSVIRAGVIPALRQGAILGSENWYVIQMLPGEHPLEELETALLRIAVNPPDQLVNQMREDTRGLVRAIKRSLPDDDSELLLFIDQFEEVFTLVEDEAERSHFLESIAAAVSDHRSRVRVVITLRADYYDRPLLYPQFGELLHTHMETVMPLSPAELERAILGPADKVGVSLEPGLTSQIVSDVSDEPGALPLLQYALTELFESRENSTLASSSYMNIGGVAGALGRSAEREFVQLDQSGKEAAKQLFLRLVRVGENTEENRRRVLQAEISSISDQVRSVTTAYGRARLLSFDRDPQTRGPTVEVAHEALLQEWPRLRGWLEENRADLRLQGILATAAGEWGESEHDASFLLRGSRLDQFEDWADTTAIRLTNQEVEFLQASLANRNVRIAEEESRRQKELEAARQLADAERNRAEEQTKSSVRLRRLAGVLGLTLIVALVISYFAFQQSRIAEDENRLSASRELAAAAVNNLDTDPELSILLALQAISTTYDVVGFVTEEAESALHQAIQASRISNSLSGPGPFPFSGVQDFDFSEPALLVPEGDGKIVFYSPSGFNRLFSIAGHSGEVIGLHLGRHLFAVGKQTGEVVVWEYQFRSFTSIDLFNSSEESTIFTGHENEITFVTFSKDGTLIAAASTDGTVKVWDVDSGEEAITLVGHEGVVNTVDFHPLGTFIATASTDQTAKVWEIETGNVVQTFSGHTEHVADVAFSHDGNRLATTSKDGSAKVWETSTGEELMTFHGHSGPVNAVDFSPSGDLLVTGGEDATARIWDLTSGLEMLVLTGHNAPIFNIIFSPLHGAPLATNSLDGTGKAWDIRPEANREWLTLNGHSEVVFDIAYSPDGTRVASASWDESVIIWSSATGSRLLDLDGHSAEVTAVNFSPDGERLVTSSFDGTLKLWDAINGGALLTIDAHSSRIHDVVFDGQGKRLASAGEDGIVMIWDASNGEELLSWRGDSRLINRLAFSPDGEQLATAGGDGTAKVWDATTGELLLTLSGHSAEVLNVSYSPAGERLATAGGDGLAKVWDIESGEQLVTLSGHGTSVWAAAYSPDGSRIATMSLDKTAKLWDADTGDELLNLIDYNDGRDLAFSPNGNHLAVASGDGSVRVYVLPIEELMALARLRITRSMTDEECQRYLHVMECPPAR